MTDTKRKVWVSPFSDHPSDTREENDAEYIARQWREGEYAKLNAWRQLWRQAANEAGFRLTLSRESASLCTTPEEAAAWAVHHARLKAELAELRAMQSQVDREALDRKQAIELGIIREPPELRQPSTPAPMARFAWPR